jgi:hypothetical protein
LTHPTLVDRQKPEAKPGEAGLAAGELMRRGDAKHRRAARQKTFAQTRAHGLGPCAFPREALFPERVILSAAQRPTRAV